MLHRPEFRAAYEQGLRRASRHFTLFGSAQAGLNAGRGRDRFGITVSRKLGKAVQRNRIRRRTREILRRLGEPAANTGAWNIVVNPRPSVAHAELGALAAELAEQVKMLRSALARQSPTRGAAEPGSGAEKKAQR